jgi:gliding motility-associated-like protein
MTSDAVCPSPQTAADTLPPFTVYAAPVVDSGQVFVLQLGQAQTLTPAVSGDSEAFSWSPATGLSNPSIEDPVADPTMTTVYQLQVTSSNGCKASAAIKVEVATPQVVLPNAFTPNGDGKNDIFYVLGGPAGSIIKRFSIFNRWGQQVFSVKDIQPGDPAYGWNGYYQGTAAPAGTYVYVVDLQDATGKSKPVTGTVILVR